MSHSYDALSALKKKGYAHQDTNLAPLMNEKALIHPKDEFYFIFMLIYSLLIYR